MFHSYDSRSRALISRQPPPAIDPHTNFGQLVLEVLARHPAERVLQIDADTGRELAADQMRLRTIRVAQNVLGLGFRKGDTAALICANSENLTPIALGLLVAGIPFIALPVTFGVEDLSHLLGLTQPKLVICDDAVYKATLEAAGNALRMKPVIFAVESELRESVRKADELLAATGSEQDFVPQYHGDMNKLIGMMLCTSGTTGRPKAVCASQAHFAVVLSRPASVTGSDRFLGFSPLYWGTGLHAMLNSIGTGMTRIITRSAFSEDMFFDLLERFRPTHVSCPPAQSVLLLSHPRAETSDFSCVKTWSLSGSHASQKLRQSLEERCPNGRTMVSYACSETGLIAMEFGKRKTDSVGQLMPHMDAKIVDESGVAVPIGEPGELLVRSPLPYIGYYNDEEATRALVDQYGWIRTGDNGYLDEQGFVYVVDRKKEFIKFRGLQISTVELEDVIEQIDGVQQVCVVGIPELDGSSELPAAVIVKQGQSDQSEDQIRDMVAKRLSDSQRLRGGIFFWEALPLTTTGKVLKKKVKEMLMENLPEKR